MGSRRGGGRIIERQGKTVEEDRNEMTGVRDSDSDETTDSGAGKGEETAEGKGGERVRQQTDLQEPRSPEACCEPALSLRSAPALSPNRGCGRQGLRRLLPRVIGTPSSLCGSQQPKPFQPLPRGFPGSPRIYFITVGGARPSPQQVPFLDPQVPERSFLSHTPPSPSSSLSRSPLTILFLFLTVALKGHWES